MADFQDNFVDNAATITANGNSPTFVRPKEDATSTVRNAVFVVSLGAAPTGTTPTLTYALQSSLDGVVWYTCGTTAALNTNGQTARLEARGVEPQWRVTKTVGGTTPSFTLVSSHLLFS